MEKQKIAIIGANVQQTPLILKAKEMGFETYVFAWQTGDEIGEKTADHFIPISAGNKEAILKECKKAEVCAVVSIGSDISALTAAYVSENLGFVSNSYESVFLATNKILTRKKLNELCINQPQFIEITDIIDKDTLGKLKYPLVVKPSDRSGGRGLKKVTNETELYNAINYAREISFEHKAIVEEYIEGQLYSCECISQNGNHRILGFVKRTVIEIGGKLCEQEHYAPANLPLSVIEKMNLTASLILDKFGLNNGASSIEFILSKDGIYIIEITPTMYGDFIGTDLLPLAYNSDYLKMVIDIAAGNEISYKEASSDNSACVHFIYNKETDFNDAPTLPDGNRYGYYIKTDKIKEFGGVRPFLFEKRTPYYIEDNSTLLLNSEYTAFWYALKSCEAKRVHLPYYIQSGYLKIIEELGIKYELYHIDESFLPLDLVLKEENDAVFFVNYFGLCYDFIKNYKAKFKIIDNSTSFYTEPLKEDGVYNIYSSRKFFPVTDGAYLISPSLKEISLEKDISYNRAKALLMAAELGEGAAYKEWQTNEQELFSKRAAMSSLTKKILGSLDYKKNIELRNKNFKILNECLKDFNLLKCEALPDAPQVYPFITNKDIREHLISKKIYVPVMWRKFICDEFENTCEKMFSEKLICLPVDSHYNEDDMKYISEIIIGLLS